MLNGFISKGESHVQVHQRGSLSLQLYRVLLTQNIFCRASAKCYESSQRFPFKIHRHHQQLNFICARI